MNFGLTFKFFSLVYIFSFWLILPIIYLFIQKYGFYRESSFENLIDTIEYTIPFYFSVFVSYFFSCFLFRKKIPLNFLNSSVNKAKKAKNFSYFLLFFSILAILFLSITRGFTLGDVSYSEQFELNSGNGMYLLLLYLYLPAVTIMALTDQNKNYFSFFKYLFLMAFFGFFVYQFTGGSRNVFIGGLISVIFIAYSNKIISLIQIILFFSVFVLLAAYFAIMRYAVYLQNEDLYYYAFLFTIDSFSPIDTLVNILKYYDERNLLGFDLFFTQFYIYIPRFLWPEKPILLYTNAMHITQVILNAPGGVVFSPSIVGTSLVMLGSKLYFIMGVITGWLLFLVDALMKSKKIIFQALGFCVLPLSFFLVRENIEIFIYRFSMTFISIVFMYILYKIFIAVLKVK